MKTNQMKYSLDEIANFGKFYKEGHSLKETANYFNVNYHTLKQILIRFGYRKPIKTLSNQRASKIKYFDNIDTHEKAYYLGYWFADGYIASTPYGKNMGMGLQLQDKYILEKLKSLLQVSNKINVYKNSCKLQLTDLHMYLSLMNLGIIEDKSHTDFHVPNINPDLINSFILGYFDGDGCISIKSTGYSVVSICSNSKVFLEEIKEILENNNIICRNIVIEKRKYNNLYVLYVSKIENQLKFKDFIYKNSSIFLKRKYNKFLQIPRKIKM